MTIANPVLGMLRLVVASVLWGGVVVSAQAANSAGAVEFANGPVRVTGAAGERLVKKGDPIEVGDEVNTGAGRAQVRFTDGGFVSLQPNTQFRVDEYNFNGKADGTEKSLFSFAKGALRAITGLIGKGSNKDAYAVRTAVATIGIRGTGYTGESDGTSLKAAVFDGRIFLRNAAGELEVTRGNAAFVRDVNTAPQLTFNRPSAGPSQTSRYAKYLQNNTAKKDEASDTSDSKVSVVELTQTNNSIPLSLVKSIAKTLGLTEDQVRRSNLSTILATQGGDNLVNDSGQNISQGTDVAGQKLLFARQTSPASPGAVNVTDNSLCGSTGCTDYYHSDVQSVSNVTAKFSDANNKRALQFVMNGEDAGMIRNVGTAKNTDSNRDDYIAWGRWEKKTTVADSEFFFTCQGCHVQTNLSQNNGFNYVVGSPTTVAQTGKAVYNLLGASTPSSTSTDAKWSGGSVQAAKVIANFDKGSIDAMIDILFPNLGNNLYRIHALNLRQSGASDFNTGSSTLIPNQTANAFVTKQSGSVADCTTNCNAWVLGFFAGNPAEGAAVPSREGAQRAGLVYTFKSDLDTASAACGNADFVGQNGSSTKVAAGACIGGSVALSKVASGAGVPGLQAASVGSASGSPDVRTGATAYFDASNSGKITVVDAGGDSFSVGSAGIADHGSSTDLTWGRWTGGFTSTTTNGNGVTTDLRATNAATHVIVGLAPTAIPTAGTASYSLLAATTPSSNSSSSAYAGGSVTGNLAVDFNNSKVSTNLNVLLPNLAGGTTFAIATGPQTVTGAGTWNASGAFATTSALGNCSAGCNATVAGFLSGTAATSAGVTYNFSNGSGSVPAPDTVQGVAAFSRGAIVQPVSQPVN